MDVVHCIGKDPSLPDDPEELVGLGHVPLNDRAETHELLRELRVLLDGYDGDRMAVGEVYLLDTARVATYYGDDDELHLNFNFPPMFMAWEAPRWHKQIARVEQELAPRDSWPTWVLSNHDNQRHRTRYGTEARARAAAVLLLTLRGTPFLYAGEELGLEDAPIPPDRVVDPGGRDGCRAPLPWDATPEHGWGTTDPWLPWPPDADTRNVEAERAHLPSVLHLYRRVIAARHGSPALTAGSLELVPLDAVPEGVLAYRRALGDDERLVLLNFVDAPAQVDLDALGAAGWIVEISSVGAGHSAGQAATGALAPDEAVILRPPT